MNKAITAFFALTLVTSAASAIALGGEQEFIVKRPHGELHFINNGKLMRVIEFQIDSNSGEKKAISCQTSPLVDQSGLFNRELISFKSNYALVNQSQRHEYTATMTNLVYYRKLCSIL